MEIINRVLTQKRGNISVARIAVLGMLLSLLAVLKYAFGFVMGVELISFMFIFLGIFLPTIDLALLIVSFNLLILTMYGFGSWWLVYWIIWPIDAFVSKFISKFTRNVFVFSAWGFVAGTMVFFWYFIFNIVFFGESFATLNLITAIPVNAIEGLTTLLAILLVAPSMAKAFKVLGQRIFDSGNAWEFKTVKNKTLNIAITIFVILSVVAAIVLLFVFNGAFEALKEALAKGSHRRGII